MLNQVDNFLEILSEVKDYSNKLKLISVVPEINFQTRRHFGTYGVT